MQWFYANHDSVDTWDKCSNTFLVKLFPISKTNALRNKSSSFTQQAEESIPNAWERMQEYVGCLSAPWDGRLAFDLELLSWSSSTR